MATNDVDVSEVTDAKYPWRDETVLRHLLHDQELSQKEAAAVLGCAEPTLSEWVHEFGLNDDQPWQDKKTLRDVSDSLDYVTPDVADEFDVSNGTIRFWWDRHGLREISNEEQPWHDESTLREVSKQCDHRLVEISDEFGVSAETIRYWWDKFGITKPHRDEETLRRLYHEEKMSTKEIGEKLGCKGCTVYQWMQKYGIETRGQPGMRAVERPPKDTLLTLYKDERLPLREIGEKFGGGPATVSRWLEEYDIDEDRQLPRSYPQLLDEKWLREQYHGEMKTSTEISDEVGCHASYVRKWMRVHGIEGRSYSEAAPGWSGEDHPMWKGGHTKWYGPNWTRQRRRRLELDGYECQVCSMTSEEHYDLNDQELHVHHIIRAAKFDDFEKQNALSNLVTLCRDHHNEWEGIPLRPGGEIDESP